MASPYHLLAAAFGLFGLLFLFHVVSVNSFSCKLCSVFVPPGCDPQDANNSVCNPDNRCGTAVWYFTDGRIRVVGRSCTPSTGIICSRHNLLKRQRIYYCDTDSCNNRTNSSYPEDDRTGLGAECVYPS